MANKTLIDIALRLAKDLGANTSKFLGTRSNVSFLGSGPQDGMLFQKSINPEMVTTIGQEKIIPAIESSMSYATGGKLNDLQLNKLIDNMTVMKETFNPTNILKGDFGIDSLRAKSGIGERQVSEAAGDVKSIDDATAGLNKAEAEADAFSKSIGFPQATDASPLMSKIENRIGNIKNETEQASAIMETIPKVDLPGKRASAREFLVNALKEGDDVGRTTFSNIIDPQDMKYIMEGGGGVEADPIVLIQKYFGPRVAELMPVGATTEQMAILTKRILENATDAKGLKPTDQGFDKFTFKLQESVKETPDGFPFAEGGIARLGLRFGGSSKILKKISNKMIKKAADDIFPTDDYKYDAEMVVDALVENNPKLFKNMLADDLDDALRSDLYGLAVRETGLRVGEKIKARRAAVDRGIVNEIPEPFKRESMKLADGVTGKGEKFKTFETTTPPRMFQLNVEKAVSELNIPREEAMRIAQLPSDQQKLALQKYLDTDMAQRTELMNYEPRKFDAAHGGLAKILEV
jgi:hypothetical protein